MALRDIKSVDFTGKKVLIRMDFNVELDAVVDIQEHFKFEVGKKTIDYVLGFPDVKVALVTHFGRPEGKHDPKYSVKQIVHFVEEALHKKIIFVSDCIGTSVETALANMQTDELLLLENVRFYPEEETNDPEFAQALAKSFDVYVNEAFSVCHRAHASVTGVPKILPGYAGLRLEQEKKELDDARLFPARPAIAIIGGAKIETKLPLIRAFEENYDCILVGGKIANEAIDQKIEFSSKVLLPQDFDSDARLDIGPNTIAYFTQIIKTGKTIVWNGPLGKFEEKPYDIGTNAVLHAILESQAFVVIGGGESLAILEKANVMNKIGFVSSGGGAMLEYMSGKKLPGLEVLEA